MLPSDKILQNRYRVLRELGHGGMGTVYEALDQRINCIVALKETIAGSNEEARRAFEREASLLGNLRHSALPKVMDYFGEAEADYLVMEFIPGQDLAQLLEQRGCPFPETDVLRIADDLLKALEYLHGQQPPILHRDIKPANLKLTEQGEIFLLDFGLAKGTAGQMPTLLTSRSVYGYTPVYASLEQIHGQGTDPRSDLYSLCATLYHLLTDVTPTDAPTRYNAVEDDQADPLRALIQINPLVSANVAAIIHQGLAMNRRQRPASAAEMRQALLLAAQEASKAKHSRAEAETRPLVSADLKPIQDDNPMALVWIPPGEFMRGSMNGDADEQPVQRVTIAKGFYMGRHAVTQAEWQIVMGNNLSHFIGGDLPAEQVSWQDAAAFISRLNEQNDEFIYRLPTEAEWEYACRAGTTSDDVEDPDNRAWYKANAAGTTHAVGVKAPNAFGLCDMLGNVWEWCEDWYHDNYTNAPNDGSAWLSGGEQTHRVLRGGSWDYPAATLRPSFRNRNSPDFRLNDNGFRLCAKKRT
jgi:formylglycine-generating enzyme required for sulfatase activity